MPTISQLDQLLSAQQPLSDLHDEMLFIVIHQTKELWLKQMLHELELAIALVGEDQFAAGLQGDGADQPDPGGDDPVVGRAVDPDPGRLSRASATCSAPRRASSRRSSASSNSGSGSRTRTSSNIMTSGSAEHARLAAGARRAEPARGVACRAGARRVRPRRPVGRGDRARPGSRSIATPSAGSTSTSWPRNWSTSTTRWPAWRHKHVLTVERIIGNKRGTGGSAGAAYLRSTLDKRAFPELWSLRTDL